MIVLQFVLMSKSLESTVGGMGWGVGVHPGLFGFFLFGAVDFLYNVEMKTQ